MKPIAGYYPILPLCCLLLFAFTRRPDNDLKASMARGKSLYTMYCQSCHADQGQGLAGVIPPLARSDYLMADKKRAMQVILYGASGEIKVNGETYNQVMTGFALNDEEVSDVLNYIRNSFGNKGAEIKPEEVKAARKAER